MKTIKIPSAKWRELALAYKPKPNFDNVMRDTYGLVRVIDRLDPFTHTYQIDDEAKYTMFVLRWL